MGGFWMFWMVWFSEEIPKAFACFQLAAFGKEPPVAFADSFCVDPQDLTDLGIGQPFKVDHTDQLALTVGKLCPDGSTNSVSASRE